MDIVFKGSNDNYSRLGDLLVGDCFIFKTDIIKSKQMIYSKNNVWRVIDISVSKLSTITTVTLYNFASNSIISKQNLNSKVKKVKSKLIIERGK